MMSPYGRPAAGVSRLLLLASLASAGLAGIARAAEPQLARVGVIPSIANASGAFGSRWVTTMDVYNPNDRVVTLKLVLRPLPGLAGLSFREHLISLAPRATRRLDLTDQLGENSAGSLDVLADGPVHAEAAVISLSSAFVVPDVVADRDDESLVFTNPPLAGGPVLGEGDVAILPDRGASEWRRVSLGIRSFEAGATLVFQLEGADEPELTLTLPPDTYVQDAEGALLGHPTRAGHPYLPSSVPVRVVAGSALLVQTVVMNATNIPHIYVATPLPRP